MTCLPASVRGTCYGCPNSSRLRPLAPRTPLDVAALCSPASQLLWPNLTSSNRSSLALVLPSFPLRPHTTTRRFEDLPGPDDVLVYVPWFFDPGGPPFASPNRLGSVAFDNSKNLGTPENNHFRGSISRPAHAATDASPCTSRCTAHGSR